AAGKPARPEDEPAEREHRHRPARPGERRGDAPAAGEEQRAGKVGRKGIAERRPGEDGILWRQVVPVNEGGGVARVKRPVRPGVVVMGQPGVGRDLDRARKEVPHAQRQRGHRGGQQIWGPAPAWKSREIIWGPAPAWKSGEIIWGQAPAWKSGEMVSPTVTPDQPATRSKARESQQ